MWATKKAVSFPKRCDGAPTPLCCSMRSKRLIRMSCISCSRFWKRAKSPTALPKDRFPEHDYHHDLERGRRADQTPNGVGLWRDRRPRIVRGDARQDSGRIKTGV